MLLNPQSWLFEALAEHDESASTRLDAFDSRDHLAIFLNWATGHGVVDDEEIGLLDALMDLERASISTQWVRVGSGGLGKTRARTVPASSRTVRRFSTKSTPSA